MHTKTITIGIVDDHTIFRKGLGRTVGSFENCTVILEASNGVELQQVLRKKAAPEILLLDLQMKEMNGFETAKWLHKQHPQIKIIILSMFAFDLTIISLLNRGAKAFLQKGIDEKDVQKAIYDVTEYGFHFSDSITLRHLAELHYHTKRIGEHSMLTEKEERSLQLASSELTYKEIVDVLKISERSVDKLRNSLFEKLNVRSRVGMTIMSLKNGIIA